MGKKDEYQFDYLDDNHRFADQINGALFQGRQVVKPDELEPAPAQSVYLGKEAGRRENFKAIVDKTRMWRGRLIHILAIENQSYVDYRMVLRNMLSESLSYHRQWKQKKNAHDRNQDLAAGTDEFFSGIFKDEKFIPVITLVVYCGMEHPWNGPKCLYDLLDIDDELKEYVSNYRLNLYDCHEHDTFDEYQTGLRQLFEVVRYGKDKKQLQKIIEKNEEAYRRIDSDTRQLLEVVANFRMEGNEDMRYQRTYNMCKALEDIKLEGIVQERLEHLIKVVCKSFRRINRRRSLRTSWRRNCQRLRKLSRRSRKRGAMTRSRYLKYWPRSMRSLSDS